MIRIKVFGIGHAYLIKSELKQQKQNSSNSIEGSKSSSYGITLIYYFNDASNFKTIFQPLSKTCSMLQPNRNELYCIYKPGKTSKHYSNKRIGSIIIFDMKLKPFNNLMS